MNLPKYYANVCEEMAPEYSDYENFEVKFGYVNQIQSHHSYIAPKRTMRSSRRLVVESTQKSMKVSTLPTTSA